MGRRNPTPSLASASSPPSASKSPSETGHSLAGPIFASRSVSRARWLSGSKVRISSISSPEELEPNGPLRRRRKHVEDSSPSREVSRSRDRIFVSISAEDEEPLELQRVDDLLRAKRPDRAGEHRRLRRSIQDRGGASRPPPRSRPRRAPRAPSGGRRRRRDEATAPGTDRGRTRGKEGPGARFRARGETTRGRRPPAEVAARRERRSARAPCGARREGPRPASAPDP